jgi:hypothetical protein
MVNQEQEHDHAAQSEDPHQADKGMGDNVDSAFYSDGRRQGVDEQSN